MTTTTAADAQQGEPDMPSPMPWRLMVLALAGELIPPEPARMGPAQYHDRQELHLTSPPLPFAAFWCERPAVRHRAPNWTDR